MLDIAKTEKLLNETAEVLEGMGLLYYLDSGTLLGAYRDKSINRYDHDIDVRIMPKQVTLDMMPELVKGLWSIGFTAVIQNIGTRAELICENSDDTMLDLKFAFQDANYLWVYCWEQPRDATPPRVHAYPRKFFEKMGEIELGGRIYPTPYPVEGYLEHHYGEWQKFKKGPEQVNMTDLAWDFMYSPLCAMSLEELGELRRGERTYE